jgi:hypothetical protein
VLERGYWRAYRNFYRWRSIARGAAAHGDAVAGLRHFAYAAGWKKFEPLWDAVIRARQLRIMTPLLEGVLSRVTARNRVSVSSGVKRGTAGPSSIAVHSCSSLTGCSSICE